MRVLLHGINFAPELTGIGKYTGEMADWLAARGHEVRVVTAPPYYPQWRVPPTWSRWRYRVERRAPGLTVWRCPLWVPARPGGLKRLLHLASFALSSLPIMLRQVAWRPDMVWVVEPALDCAPQALLVARLCGAPAWLHVQDFEVDAAFELGLLRGARTRAAVLRVERALMSRFDRVSTISARMLERLRDKGVEPTRSVLSPNWVDLDAIQPLPRGAAGVALRAQWSIPEDAIVALYSGNMGAKQGLGVLAEAARLLRTHYNVIFVLCGEGSGKKSLENACVGLGNVRFLDLQPIERLNELLNMADVHLLPQRADAADLVMPSKLTGMFASGRPVIAAARPHTALAATVSGCGIVVEPEQPAALAEAIATLAQDAPRRAALGAAARRYAVTHLGRDAVLGALERAMLELCGKAASSSASEV